MQRSAATLENAQETGDAEQQLKRLGSFLIQHYPADIARGAFGAESFNAGIVSIAIRLLSHGVR